MYYERRQFEAPIERRTPAVVACMILWTGIRDAK